MPVPTQPSRPVPSCKPRPRPTCNRVHSRSPLCCRTPSFCDGSWRIPVATGQCSRTRSCSPRQTRRPAGARATARQAESRRATPGIGGASDRSPPAASASTAARSRREGRDGGPARSAPRRCPGAGGPTPHARRAADRPVRSASGSTMRSARTVSIECALPLTSSPSGHAIACDSRYRVADRRESYVTHVSRADAGTKRLA